MLLEPKMKLEVVTPGEFLGNIQADLQSRRAIITGSEPRGDLTVIDAEVALAKMFGYSTQVRSLSQGRGELFDGTAQIRRRPPEVLAEMLGGKRRDETVEGASSDTNPKRQRGRPRSGRGLRPAVAALADASGWC